MHTMEDLRKLAINEPIVNGYLQFVHYNEMNLEQALIGMVVELSKYKNEVMQNHIEHMKRCSTPMYMPSVHRPTE